MPRSVSQSGVCPMHSDCGPGFSKFISGVLGARASPRVILGGGLMATAVVNIGFGFGASYVWFLCFWALNGLLQANPLSPQPPHATARRMAARSTWASALRASSSKHSRRSRTASIGWHALVCPPRAQCSGQCSAAALFKSSNGSKHSRQSAMRRCDCALTAAIKSASRGWEHRRAPGC